jgi:hypothetical protein
MVIGESLWGGDSAGTGVAGTLKITAKAGNTVTFLNPTAGVPPGDMYKSVYDTTNDGIVDHATLADNLVDSTVILPTIWSVRQRSFNAITNPNFEVNQVVPWPLVQNSIATNGYVVDRWGWYLNYPPMTGNASGQSVKANVLVLEPIFYILLDLTAYGRRSTNEFSSRVKRDPE